MKVLVRRERKVMECDVKSWWSERAISNFKILELFSMII